MIFDFLPKTDKAHDGAFDARGLSCLDMWHLLEVAVDPAYEGKGESAPRFCPAFCPSGIFTLALLLLHRHRGRMGYCRVLHPASAGRIPARLGQADKLGIHHSTI